MAKRVTIEDIRQMNEIYYHCKSYAETARQTGWSAATVRNYIDKNFVPTVAENICRFNPKTDLPDFSIAAFRDIDNYGDLCHLSEAEIAEIKLLWEELPI